MNKRGLTAKFTKSSFGCICNSKPIGGVSVGCVVVIVVVESGVVIIEVGEDVVVDVVGGSFVTHSTFIPLLHSSSHG